MKNTRILAIIVGITSFVGAALGWLAFNHELTEKIARRPLLLVLFVLAVTAIYPLYRVEKSWPTFAWGINLVLASLFLTMCSIAGSWIGVSGTCTDLVEDGSEALFLIAIVILVWKASANGEQRSVKRE